MGLKESKKFSIGSVHENGGGKFEILARWFDEKTETIMLKYKFLEDGRVEENKEANVNASEWKWRKVRGLAGSKSENTSTNEDMISRTDMEEYFEGTYIRIEKHNFENKENFQELKDILNKQQEAILELMSVIKVQQSQIENLINDKDIINKLLEKI